MAPQAINIGRKKYAVGLFWQPTGSGRSASDEAVRIEKLAPASKFRYYAGYRNSVGLAADMRGLEPGLSVLAPELVESFGDSPSFAAAFRVQGGIYILAVRNGVIIPDYDRLFHNEADAVKSFNALLELPDWSLIVAPESWGVRGAVDKNIEEVISGRVNVALKRIGGGGSFLGNFAVLAVVLFAVFYFFQGDVMKIITPFLGKPAPSNLTPEAAAEFRKKMESKNAGGANAPSVAAKMPWENIPNRAEFANRCTMAIAFVMQQIYGWNAISVECANGKVSARLRRDYGTAEDLYTSAATLMPNVKVNLSGGSDADLTGTFAKIPGENSAPAADLAAVERQVRSAFQQVNMSASISRAKEIIADGAIKKEIGFISVKAESKIMPAEFIKFFDGIPAVETISIRWDNVKNEWSYEERIYAK
ncbi:MAG: type 4b pilus protein PilO2 [Rickettsiales bacterium]|jgi:hypothetical protein|nr:type 4b pilus protein PilO2 [Rickettsiales bacterium]